MYVCECIREGVWLTESDWQTNRRRGRKEWNRAESTRCWWGIDTQGVRVTCYGSEYSNPVMQDCIIACCGGHGITGWPHPHPCVCMCVLHFLHNRSMYMHVYVCYIVWRFGCLWYGNRALAGLSLANFDLPMAIAFVWVAMCGMCCLDRVRFCWFLVINVNLPGLKSAPGIASCVG